LGPPRDADEIGELIEQFNQDAGRDPRPATSTCCGSTTIRAHRGVRTAELVTALDRATEASLAKSESSPHEHEIRTPMNGIIGMTDIVLDAS